ncbi:MAG: hypothetical protein CMJ31_13410 [Phycisphaerae bacterium]|nr:hypothetical protein [Phycisphaerae bacterium]
MAKKPNTFLRLLIPALLVVLGICVAVAVGVNTSRSSSNTTVVEQPPERAVATDSDRAASDPSDRQVAPKPSDLDGSAADIEPLETAAEADEDVSPVAEGDAIAASTLSFRARDFGDQTAPAPIGSLDAENAAGYEGYIEFYPLGAGVKSYQLTHSFRTIEQERHVELQAVRSISRPNGATLSAVPFALLSIDVNGVTINMSAPGVWRPIESGVAEAAFEAIIETSDGDAALRLVRRFTFRPGSFDLSLDQRIENLTDRPIDVRLTQTGPVDLPDPATRYGGDKRRFRFGYLLNEQQQGSSAFVTADHELRGRQKVLGKKVNESWPFSAPIWPTDRHAEKGFRLSWFAMTDRYFGVAVHPSIADGADDVGAGDKLLRSVETIDRLVLNPNAGDPFDAVIVSRMVGPTQTIAPRQTLADDLGIYAGPLLAEVLAGESVSKTLNLDDLIVYNLGGFCGEMCTFGWLTDVLFFVLKLYHGFTFDWAVAIILLVITVRTCLHPITRYSQINMQRFGAQMQSLKPKQDKIRERYKDDPKRMQEETARLFREEGINPAGFLGCLPMMLQSPIWIALYATLYFAAELRHEPAFYGVFQAISGGHWQFLGDLASSDRAIPLPSFAHVDIPFLSRIYGTISSINLLPILMGVLFFLHQKYLTPPSTATMSPDQEQMQKTMRVMFPLMMPIFMYTAPSGLVIYFITNSTLGILESRWIRSHAQKHGLTDPEKIKAAKAARRSSGKQGFLQRLQAMAEEQQKLRAQAKTGGGKRRVQNTAPNRRDPGDRYKKRR